MSSTKPWEFYLPLRTPSKKGKVELGCPTFQLSWVIKREGCFLEEGGSDLVVYKLVLTHLLVPSPHPCLSRLGVGVGPAGSTPTLGSLTSLNTTPEYWLSLQVWTFSPAKKRNYLGLRNKKGSVVCSLAKKLAYDNIYCGTTTTGT